ncbi:hypothetical protein ACIOC2_01375 [Streptomyces sp. NPDC088337]|uniref:hypothetical protein n=1 Tax=unclassified Streptomyces TaxID=2593676 RepID=UPI0037FE823D
MAKPPADSRRAAVCDWLTANGINPNHVPVDSDLTIEVTEQGRVIRFEAFVLNDDGHPQIDERGQHAVREVRTTPLHQEPPEWWEPYQKPTREQLTADLDGAYREHAHLVALLAAMTDGALIAPAPDVDEPGWQIAYLTIGGRQATWHISPRDADLFAHVEPVEPDDPRAQWDGHTTEEKYAHIAALTTELMQRCGPACAEQHTETGRCAIAKER